MDEVELPRAVALAWGVAANPQRGPKRELSIERIVEVAVDLADAGGLAAVSMAAIATELGVTSMALYRYVTSKDDLLVLMQEEGIGLPPPTGDRESPGWRDAIEEWCTAMREVYREHLWLLDVPVEGTPTTPHNLAWLDAALERLQPIELPTSAKVAFVLALIAQVRWETHIARGAFDEAAPGSRAQGAERLLASLVTADDLPFVRAAVDAGVFSPSAPDDPFAFGRALVIEGMAALVDGTETAPPRTVEDPLADAIARDPKVKEAVSRRRDAEKALREALKRERELRRAARERLTRG